MEFPFTQQLVHTNPNQSVLFHSRNSSSFSNPADLLHTVLMSYSQYRLAMDLEKYGLLTIIVVGCLANFSAFILMVTMRSIPMCNYLAALAMVDSCVLLGPCLTRWLPTQQVDDPQVHNTALCRSLHFLHYWSSDVSAWILVAMTVDRFVAISFPLHARLLSTPKRARIVISILALIIALANCHVFFTMEVKSTRQACVGYDQYNYFLQVIWPWVDATIYSFSPFVLIFVFNILIIKSHYRYLKVHVTLTGLGGPLNNTTNAPNLNCRLTVMLLVVTFMFVLLTAPRALLFLIRDDVLNFKPRPNFMDFEILATLTLTSSVVNLLMFANHGINFFLYCLTGRSFRQQFRQTLSKTYKNCTQLRKTKIAPSETNITLNRCTSYEERNQHLPAINDVEQT